MSSAFFTVREHRVPASHIREYDNSTSTTQEEVLEIAVKQYKPIEGNAPIPKDAVTIIACPGSSLPKETYQPLWDELLKHSKRHGFAIRSIWIADAVSMGYSGVLNEKKLGYDTSWMDNGRDLLLMINRFRAEMPRPIVGIGHSAGGQTIINLSLLHPRLFATTILLDPFIVPIEPNYGFKYPGLTNITAYMPDVFPSREAAARIIRKSAAYRTWDPRAQDAMIKHGFRDLPTALHPQLPESCDREAPPVTYTTTKHNWVWQNVRENFAIAASPDHKIDRDTHADLDPSVAHVPVYRPELWHTLRHLPEVRPSALFLLASNSYIDLDLLRDAIAKCGCGVGGSGGVPEGRVKEITLDAQNHSFPQEVPALTAEHCGTWLGIELERFRKRQAKLDQENRERDPRDHLRLNAEWLDVIKPVSYFTEKPRIKSRKNDSKL